MDSQAQPRKKRNKHRKRRGVQKTPAAFDLPARFDAQKLFGMTADLGLDGIVDASVIDLESGEKGFAFRGPQGDETRCAIKSEETDFIQEGQNAVRVYVEHSTAEEGGSPVIEASIVKAQYLDNLKRLEEIYAKGERVAGIVVGDTKGGYTVALGAESVEDMISGKGVRAFLPRGQASHHRIERHEIRGLSGDFQIKEMNPDRAEIIVTRKEVASEQEAKAQEAAWARLEEGQIVTGRVKNIVRYGAFVGLDGIDALLHQTDLVWDKVVPVHQIIRLGEVLELKVLEVNREEKRLRVGLKQLTPDPFEAIKDKYQEGAEATGTVVALTDFGAFVQMPEGIEGLIHVSEMSWERIKHPQDHFEIGQEVKVMILGLDSVARKLSLSKKALEKNPVEKVAEKFPEGTRITTNVKSIVDFGVFVSLDETVDGLVHIGEISWTKRPSHPSDLLNEGDEIEVVVTGYDTKRQRVSCSIKQVKEDPFKAWQSTYEIGKKVTMTVTRLTDKGAIQELEDGLTIMCSAREIAEERVNRIQEAAKVGQELEGIVIDFDRRNLVVSLSVKRLLTTERREAYQSYLDKQEETTSQRTTLGDALKGQLKTPEPLDE